MEDKKYSINVVGTMFSDEIVPGDILISGTEDVVKNGDGHFLTVNQIYGKNDERTEVSYYEDNYFHSTKVPDYCHFKVLSQPNDDIINVMRIVSPTSSLITDNYVIGGTLKRDKVKTGDMVLIGDIVDNQFKTLSNVGHIDLGGLKYCYLVENSNGKGEYAVLASHCLFKLVSMQFVSNGKKLIVRLVD